MDILDIWVLTFFSKFFLARTVLMICNLDKIKTVDDCCRRLSLISMILRCGNFSCACSCSIQKFGF